MKAPPRTPRQQEIAAQILALVGEYAAAAEVPEFVPGSSRIGYAGRVYDEKELCALVDASLEFYLTAGHHAHELERGLARWYGVRHCALVNSGSSANLVAIAALTSEQWGERRLCPGDEVITAAAGFPTTVTPILQCGAVPVFVDIEAPGLNVSLETIKAAWTPKTKAVMLAHTLGNPFEAEALATWCKERGAWLIEDNCDAAGSTLRGRKTGTFGDLATLSFYPPHHMTTGEGGAVLCRSPKMMKVVESIRDWGRDCWCPSGCDDTCGRRFDYQLGELPPGYNHKYSYSHLGYNLKMTDLQAAIGRAQLEKLDAFVDDRRANWRFFRRALRDCERWLELPEATSHSDPSWFGFTLRVRPTAPFRREQLVAHLEPRGIQTRMLFGGNLTRQPALVNLRRQCEREGRPAPFRIHGELKTSDAVMSDLLWIGVYPGLGPEQREFVAQTISAFVGRKHLAPISRSA